MTGRVREFDILRAFAALSVIAIHVTANDVTDNPMASFWNELMRYSVPIFIMISGSVLMYAELQRGTLPFLTFQRKRFGKILLPYILWTVFYVYFGARTVWQKEGTLGLVRIAHTLPSHLQNADGWFHLYFLLIILQLYLLYPLLRAGLQRWPMPVLGATLALTLFDQMSFYLNRPIWRYDFFPNWLFYFVFGMFFTLKMDSLEKKLRGRERWLGLGWLLSFALLLVDGRLTHTSFTSIKPSVILYSLTSYLFFFMIARSMKDRRGWKPIGRWVDWISTQSFFIYLAHPFILNLLYLFAVRIHHASLWDSAGGLLAKYVLTVGITVVGTMVVTSIPFMSIIGAVRTKPRIAPSLYSGSSKM